MISNLSHLIRAAATYTIREGSEQITRDLLDAIAVDHAPEPAGTQTTPPRQCLAG